VEFEQQQQLQQQQFQLQPVEFEQFVLILQFQLVQL